MMNIIFIAPPAAGKGTISDLLVKKYGFVHISTGNLLREEVKKETVLGREINELISNGEFVSDELVTKLLKKSLSLNDKPFILDGYPRDIEQAHILEELLSGLKIDNYVAIYLDVDKEEAIERVLGRLVCTNCNTSFNKHVESLKPKIDGICDRCCSVLEQRHDDSRAVYNQRYKTFLEKTYPIVEFYKNEDSIYFINGNLGYESAFQKIEKIISEA